MPTRNRFIFLLVTGVLLAIGACTEPFEVETTDFEDILIINASITTETKRHKIFITRSYQEGDDEVQVSGATVEVLVNNASSIQFEEASPGVYQSTVGFAAEPEVDYQLKVTDEKGETFASPQVQLTAPTAIDQITAKRVLNEDGEDGVEIYVDGTSTGDNEGYFRYEYEETYRWESFYKPLQGFRVVSESPPLLEIVYKEKEERVCYVTETSNSILIAETNNLSEDRVEDFPVRFIERRDRRIAHRYSILVKQYAQTRVSHEFYQTLKSFSSSDNLFSQPQPGLVVGNVRHVSDDSVKVVGLFEVVSFTTNRFFFSFQEIFGNDIPFLDDCGFDRYSSLSDPELFQRVQSGQYKYIGEDPPFVYQVAPAGCVDCTLYGSNEVPDFWVEQ
ncbi:DUF4249 domain-containing protein [Flagellimonas halotolerans]|uniref:DUF4249 domain-containing protein n=1 Tax=Flagellimonas halotolerans TaxID=3112164 RepID=A0ABU6ILU1_9FLAO|nr:MULTISPECIES: DUF4249 domain-containing protein [unclassified Allomuricauda]MEC3964203.1 DUF4249 domain-containing protein [Muricauda sp. SYSU M86414]MEC4264073.1 DUF4249 domain-containing protein [Muricauda sp. SYSU M84420]